MRLRAVRHNDRSCSINGSGRVRPPRGRLIVVANRAPISHKRTSDGRIIATRTASGLVTALDSLVTTHAGTWVAHGAGEADRLVADVDDGFLVPGDGRRYRLRYVWLNEREYRGYYCGFANEGLWPLCHDLNVRPVFRRSDFEAYEAVNRKFVAAAAQESAGRLPLVLIQDYHFALAPRLLRSRLPASTIVTFWHIPWPRPDVLAACPWAPRLLQAALLIDPNDVAGTARALHCALDMSEPEQALRMRLLRSVVRTSSAQWWTERLLHDAYRGGRETSPIAADSPPSVTQSPA